MGDVCNPASKKKTDFQKLLGGNHILNIKVIDSLGPQHAPGMNIGWGIYIVPQALKPNEAIASL